MQIIHSLQSSAYSSYIKGRKNSTLTEICQQILDVDSKYAHSPSTGLPKQRLRLQTEFNPLSTHEATRLILKSTHNVYKI